MEYIIGFIIGILLAILVIAVLAGKWLDDFMKNWWN